MFRNLDDPHKAKRVGMVLAIIAAVYLGITAIVVTGIMVDGPVNVVEVAAKPGGRIENCDSYTPGSSGRARCQDRNAAAGSLAQPERLKEVPDWTMRIATSGGVLLVASFFFSIVLGLAAIVARLSAAPEVRSIPGPE